MADEIDTEELEQIVTLNQLKEYDNKKGTAVVDSELPTTVENRTYRKVDSTDELKTQVWVKDTEMETKAQADYLANHYVKYVTALPSPIDTDIVYGIEHTYSQDVDSKYLVQDFISTFMKVQSTNSWLLNDSVTSTYATITYEDTDYEFNKLYWTGKRYVTYIWDESTGTSTRVGNFGIQIGDLWNYKLTWNYQHKDYYVSDSTNAKATKLANMTQVEDWYLKKEELGKANGVAVLDGDGKIPKNELNFTALNYLGMTHTWPTDSDPEAGDFYIVDQEFTHDTTTLEPGDWIIYFTSWEVESNNVIVSSVNGKIGTVVLTGDDINVTYEDVTDTINNTLPKLGVVKTVNDTEVTTGTHNINLKCVCNKTDGNNYAIVKADANCATMTSHVNGTTASLISSYGGVAKIETYSTDNTDCLCINTNCVKVTSDCIPTINGNYVTLSVNSNTADCTGNISTIDDTSITNTCKTWSANKINTALNTKTLPYLSDANDISAITTDRQYNEYYVTAATTNIPKSSAHGYLTMYRINSSWYIERLFSNTENVSYWRTGRSSTDWDDWSTTALTVNGVAADNSGNIVIPSGGITNLGKNNGGTAITDTTICWSGCGPLSIGFFDCTQCCYCNPTTYGNLLTIVPTSCEVNQLWLTQGGYGIYQRVGNRNGWSGGESCWIEYVNSCNLPKCVIAATQIDIDHENNPEWRLCSCYVSSTGVFCLVTKNNTTTLPIQVGCADCSLNSCCAGASQYLRTVTNSDWCIQGCYKNCDCTDFFYVDALSTGGANSCGVGVCYANKLFDIGDGTYTGCNLIGIGYNCGGVTVDKFRQFAVYTTDCCGCVSIKDMAATEAAYIIANVYDNCCSNGYTCGYYAMQGSSNNLITAGNEFNFVPPNYCNTVYINYMDSCRCGTAYITCYIAGNGHGGTLGKFLIGTVSGSTLTLTSY